MRFCPLIKKSIPSLCKVSLLVFNCHKTHARPNNNKLS
uniref:Uncharacterized protein n=1 Tax=Rhizophora mucronata TaxID=61149 RepID=A0A2P2P764_RHIMU